MFEAQAAYIEHRYAHLLASDRDHARVQQAALNNRATHCYSTAGRNISHLGINAFSPVPLRMYIGNANHGRVLKTKPQDMRGKWEYDLDTQGIVLRARYHEEREGSRYVADNLLIPSACPNEKTYLHYWQKNGFDLRQDHCIIYAHDAQGRIAACLNCRWNGSIDRILGFELEEFCWDSDCLTGVDNYYFTPRQLAYHWDEHQAVSILGQPYQCLHRRFCSRSDG